MKKISFMLFSVIVALSTSAQKAVVVRPPVVHPVPRMVYYYPRPYYYNPYYLGFNYMYNTSAYYHSRPTKLDMQVQDIENEYSDRIRSVKADDSLSHHERKQKIRALKQERSHAVDDAKKNYYKQYEG